MTSQTRERPEAADHGRAPAARRLADADVERRAPRPLEVRLLDAQHDDRDVRHRERDHRAEDVQVGEQRRLAGEDAAGRRRRRTAMIETYGRQPLRVHAAQHRRQLAVLAQRVGEPRDADEAGVGGDERGWSRPGCRPRAPRMASSQPRLSGRKRTMPEHRVFRVVAAELRAVEAGDARRRPPLVTSPAGSCGWDDRTPSPSLDRHVDVLRPGRSRAPRCPARLARHHLHRDRQPGRGVDRHVRWTRPAWPRGRRAACRCRRRGRRR